MTKDSSTLRDTLQQAINSVSAENGSNTPDYILAAYLQKCLYAFDDAVIQREQHYGYAMQPAMPDTIHRRIEP